MLLLLSFLWSVSFLFINITVRQLPPFTIVLARVGLSALFLLPLIYLSGHRLPRDPKLWLSFAFMGIISNLLPFSLITWGQIETPVGLTSIILAATPLVTVTLAHFLTPDEPLSMAKIISVILGLIGVAVLIGPSLLDGLDIQALSQLAILGAAFFYGMTAIYARRYRDLPPMVVTTCMLLCTTILLVPITLWIDQPWTLRPDGLTLGALAGLAVLSTALAYIIYFEILATAGATSAALVTFLIPVSALLLGIFLLDEQLTGNSLLGMALIFVGLIIIDGRLPKLLKLS